MENFELYVGSVGVLISSVLATALAVGIKQLQGKNWLIASTVISLIAVVASRSLQIFVQYRVQTADFSEMKPIYDWYPVVNILYLFGAACFGLFLFANWSRSRMDLDIKNLLFSFSGRIPRSAFWISVCLIFPLGTLLGFIPYTVKAEGLPIIIIWTVYVGWLILGSWIILAIYAKRWHDCSKSGWMTLVALIPVIGTLWLLGYLGFVRGKDGKNQYGTDPLSTQES